MGGEGLGMFRVSCKESMKSKALRLCFRAWARGSATDPRNLRVVDLRP